MRIHLKSQGRDSPHARGGSGRGRDPRATSARRPSRASRPGSSIRSRARGIDKHKVTSAFLGYARRVPGGRVHLDQRGHRPRHPAQERGPQGRRHHRDRLRDLQARFLRRHRPDRHGRQGLRREAEAGRDRPRRPRERRSSCAASATGSATSATRSRAMRNHAAIRSSASSSATGPAGRCTRTRRSRTSATPGDGKRMKTGLVIAVEPMVNAGAPEVEVLDDNWTAVTKDRSMSAHFEHTIAITDEGPWVLTRPSSTPEAVETTERESHEGTSFRQTDLPQVQGHQAQGRRSHHLHQPAPQAASGLRGQSWLASQASTSRATSASRSHSRTSTASAVTRRTSSSSEAGISPDKKSDDLDENDVRKIRDAIEANYRVEGDLRRDVQLNIKRLIDLGTLPRRASSPQPAGSRSAHAHQRPHPQGSAPHGDEEDGRGHQEVRRGTDHVAPSKPSRRRRSGRTSRPASRTSRRRSTTRSSRSPTSPATSSRGRAPARAGSRARASRRRSPRSSPPRTPRRRRWSTASAT